MLVKSGNRIRFVADAVEIVTTTPMQKTKQLQNFYLDIAQNFIYLRHCF